MTGLYDPGDRHRRIRATEDLSLGDRRVYPQVDGLKTLGAKDDFRNREIDEGLPEED